MSSPPLDEATFECWEASIPQLAVLALQRAFYQALESGYPVLVAEQGTIYELHADGSRLSLKQIEPPTPVIPGTRWEIQ
jgi:hypothetical protein